MQNPDARRRTIVAALIAIGVIAVLAIALLSRGGNNQQPAVPTSVTQNNDNQPEIPEQPQGAEGVELGSMIVNAYRCPEKSTPDSDCKNAGPVDLSQFSMVLPDGQTVDLDNAMRPEDGSYQWLNIPTDTYTLLASNLAGPDGLTVRNIAGPVQPNGDGWTITNSDPNQPVMVDILFAPSEGSPAAG